MNLTTFFSNCIKDHQFEIRGILCESGHVLTLPSQILVKIGKKLVFEI